MWSELVSGSEGGDDRGEEETAVINIGQSNVRRWHQYQSVTGLHSSEAFVSWLLEAAESVLR